VSNGVPLLTFGVSVVPHAARAEGRLHVPPSVLRRTGVSRRCALVLVRNLPSLVAATVAVRDGPSVSRTSWSDVHGCEVPAPSLIRGFPARSLECHRVSNAPCLLGHSEPAHARVAAGIGVTPVTKPPGNSGIELVDVVVREFLGTNQLISMGPEM
jgi:hypothetical protein